LSAEKETIWLKYAAEFKDIVREDGGQPPKGKPNIVGERSGGSFFRLLGFMAKKTVRSPENTSSL